MTAPSAQSVAAVHPFEADVDVGELDDRGRPSAAWTARTVGLSRSEVVLVSRRPGFVGRELIVAVHLIDAEPTPLFGTVSACEYDGDGRHRIVLGLREMPESMDLVKWLRGRAPRRRV